MFNITSKFSKMLLYLFGWHLLDPTILQLLRTNPYIICVFSHTSYYDFFFMILYYLSYKELSNLKTLIKPDYFKYIGWLLYKIGGIPSTNIAYKNGGNVTKIVEVLKSTPSSQLLICPKGTIMKGEWRSGYYQIAKALQANLIAIGVDYELKKINIGNMISYHLPELEIKSKLYQDLSKIVPLYPEREMMKIRKYDITDVNVIHPDRLIGFYTIIISCISILYLYKFN